MIILEVTESVAMSNLTQVKMVIDKLHTMGFSISMDDFGSGYSSLNTLKAVSYTHLNPAVSLWKRPGPTGQVERSFCQARRAFQQIDGQTFGGSPEQKALGAKQFFVWVWKAADPVPYDHGRQHG